MNSTTKPNSTDPRNEYGLFAEQEAERWWAERLLVTGGRILVRNERYRCGEIDLIAEEGRGAPVLVFVEIRSRRYPGIPLYRPVETLSFGKRRRIERAANLFLGNYRGRSRAIRFDLLVREEVDGTVNWTHLPGAWLTGS